MHIHMFYKFSKANICCNVQQNQSMTYYLIHTLKLQKTVLQMLPKIPVCEKLLPNGHALTLSRQRRSLPYRNQSTDLLCKSMDWLLYDSDLHYKRVKLRWSIKKYAMSGDRAWLTKKLDWQRKPGRKWQTILF